MAWYGATVILPLVPLSVVWYVDRVLANKVLGWSDLFGRGELLVIAIPVSAMALATMHAANGLRATPQTLIVLIALVLFNGLALTWLIAFSLAKALVPATDDATFVGPSVTLFLATVFFGAVAVRMSQIAGSRKRSD